MLNVSFSIFSTFIGNDDGGGGGVLSTAYLPLRFTGNSRFSQNRGRTLAVSNNAIYHWVCVQSVGLFSPGEGNRSSC